MGGKFQFAIDRGGTFTDVWSRLPDGRIRTMKLLSEDPDNYPDAPREGIRRIIAEFTNEQSKSNTVDAGHVDWIRMGTTVATNALLERKGQRMALVITKGFRDLLYIGTQARPNIFDLEIVTPEVLYEDVVEAEERVVLAQERCQLNTCCPRDRGTTGEEVEIWKRLDEIQLKADLNRVLQKGIKSIAVVLMHSYLYAEHERRVGEVARDLGFEHVSLSSETMPMVRIVSRGYTACADAYLTPCIRQYVRGFASGFKQSLDEMRVLFMQSDGGLTPVQKFSGSKAILSGPAGGVIGYALTTYDRETKQPVIGFDMGGTSTDVSRYAGSYEHAFETTTAGVTIQAPQLDINTVAAGGGSQLFFRAGMFVVGPESAGAHPGPVCYKKGGFLAVTDANLCLGRLLPDYFPAIFGPSENEPLDKDATMRAFKEVTQNVNLFMRENSCTELSVEEVAMGFIRVANETMCRPIRALTQAKGYDTARHVLACFGGAGAQHACAIARNLGMSTVFVHRHAGILSAFGLALADVVHEAQEPSATIYQEENYSRLDSRLDILIRQCIRELLEQGIDRQQIEVEPFLHLRYERTDCALMCSGIIYPPCATSSRYGDFRRAFTDRYYQEFGFTIPERNIIVDDIRVRGVGRSAVSVGNNVPKATEEPKAEKVTSCYFESGYRDTPVFRLENLFSGHVICGPAIIMSSNSTILVEPDCSATITNQGDVRIALGRETAVRKIGPSLDAIQLSIFSHRFMSIAEQMGRVLQRTAISTNIKERLDFSCALFGPDGGLVANAPHIPVHLGAMQEAVQFQMRNLKNDLNRGDVILSNHPQAGGSHLPDLTVITPVFYGEVEKPIFFVACRGHHADIGGAAPGSMPPFSTHINQEGAVFMSFKLVKNGEFQEKALIEALNEPAKFPACSGTRNLADNLSDLKAQVAANKKGIGLVLSLIDEYGLDVVQAYMDHIQSNAEVAVREMLTEIGKKNGVNEEGIAKLSAADQMDDGSEIVLNVEINVKTGSGVFDFTGTDHEVYGNLNAPRAITLSALIYCLRCMVGHDVPLNQGCLAPIQVKIPPNCLLDPSPEAAVVGGNVLTSQRIVDVVFRAFQTCAASQGCMNNVTFGDKTMGYYETVAGGAGAGPSWHGRSGVHTHMTNTKITDPEILERRYPVVLERFNVHPGTGGRGLYNGGDGVDRELLFRKDVTLSILSERRVLQPFGLKGGQPGRRGKNTFTFKDGRKINFRGKGSIEASAGDRFLLETPGGGGYGALLDEAVSVGRPIGRDSRPKFVAKGSVHEYKMSQESA